eukprot:gene9941-7811_t
MQASMRASTTRAFTRRSPAAFTGRRSVVVCAASAAELNKQFGIAGSVEIVEGEKGSTKVVLKHDCGSSAEIYLFGGVVTSWKQASGDEFGPGEMQQHGFARNLEWDIATTSADPNPDNKEPTLELTLTEWPYKFKVVYSVTLHGETLMTEMRVMNTDDKEFEFSAALHSYIEVESIEKAKVNGLKGLTYLDKSKDASNPVTKTEDRESFGFDGYMDSVYLNAPASVGLEVGNGAEVCISAKGWEDVVVWNPWETMKACYERFACVENAKFGTPAKVAPGESWVASADFSVKTSQAAK